jgi:RNA polymerase sigma-70 factor (ECF subfamily)
MPDEFDLEQLYDEHAQALYAFALELTRNEADTKDVLQSIFAKLAREPRALQNVRNARAYLLRLAHNAAIDLIRRRATRDKYADEFGRESEQVFQPASNPDDEGFRLALSDALGELPPDQRMVVHLRLWENLKFEEIADMLGISPNTAGSRYRYGIDKLRKRLRPLYDEIK